MVRLAVQAHPCEGAVTGSRGRGLWVIAVEKATGQPLQCPRSCPLRALNRSGLFGRCRPSNQRSAAVSLRVLLALSWLKVCSMVVILSGI
jgi:hypothetical protein